MLRLSSIIRQSVRCVDSLLGVRSISTSLIDISSEVQNALKFTPHRVVALESTIITHGMPYPQNLDTALAVEDIVRQEGAIPATIAIMDGRIKVGLGADQLHSLAKADRDETIKTSRRDMAYVVASGRQGGTTVAGTLLIANSVGIRIFATGGIGGVHRDVAETMDISADLIELGRCPVTVVCSGVKSILDIPRTLEYLETNGVFVSTFGCENHEFPAFYTRSSGSKAPYNFNDAIEAAKVLHVNRELGLLSGMLIGVPIPEQCALNRSEMDAAIQQALQKSKQNGIHGKEATPFILAAVSQLTKGKSLEANMALIKNNARVAAKIAVELDRLQFHQHDSGSVNNTNQASETENINRTPLCIGGSVIDISLTVLEDSFELNGGTYHAEQYSSAGGVARNIAEAIYKMYGNVHLITAVGNDRNGEYIRQLLPKQCDSSIIKTNDYATCNFSLLHDRQGDCRIIVGDMNAIQAIDPEWIKKNVHLLQQSPLTIIDANISEAVMQTIFRECLRYNRPVFYEPTDMRIAAKPFIGDLALATSARQAIRFSSPNLEELRQLAKALQYPHPMSSTPMEAFQSVDELLDEVKPLGEFVSQIIDNLLVTLGKHGVAIFRRCSDTVPFFDPVTGSYQEPEKQCLKAQGRFYKAHVHPKIVNVSGAGDSFTSGFIVAAIAGKPEPVCVSVGLEAASCALLTRGAVADRYFDETHPSWNANSTAYKTF